MRGRGRARRSARGSFPGELVIVAIGMHEAPGGRGEDLTYLLGEHGFTADLGVVCELGGPTLPVAHSGCATSRSRSAARARSRTS